MKHITWKKITALSLCATLSLTLLAGCGGKQSDPTPGVENTQPSESQDAQPDYSSMSIEQLKPLIQTINAGKLTVATSPDFAPAEFYAIGEDGSPTLAGHDIALAQHVADYLGLELEMVAVDFDGVIMELQTKSVDMGVASFAATPERANSMDFTVEYDGDAQSFVCTQSNKGLFPDIASTNKADYSFGAQVASIQVGIAQTNSPEAELVQLSKVTDIVAELLAGKLDGAYIATEVAEAYAKQYPELYVALDVDSGLDSGTCAGVVKDNPALLAAVNLAITDAVESGKMEQYRQEAEALAAGETYEGLLDAQGNAQG